MGRAVAGAPLLATALLAVATPAAGQPASRVEDIGVAGGTGSAPGRFTAMGGVVYFGASDPANGSELWRTDGTASGTRLVRDIQPGPGGLSPTHLTAMGDTLFFAAAGSLWKTDGNAAGTVRIRPDIRDPLDLVALDGLLYFTAEQDALGRELWRTDGTEAGTSLVRDIHPGAIGSYPLGVIALDHTLYFAAIGLEGDELWRSDGTEAGTVLVKDIVPGQLSSAPELLTPARGQFYFRAGTVNEGRELWKSDGTEAGTVLIKDIQPGPLGSFPWEFALHGATLYFGADDGTSGVELWKSDGTEAGTVLVRDIRPGLDPSYPMHLTPSGGFVYFTADDGVNGSEVWRTNGTPGGTAMVGSIVAASDQEPFGLTDLGGVLYFRADDGLHGSELWRTDGTAPGTYVLDLNPGPAPSQPDSVAAVDGALYFGATPPGATLPNYGEPWKSDGTLAGSAVIAFLNPTPSASVFEAAAFGDALVFSVNDGIHGFEPWRSDGTPAGTHLLKDIRPGPDSGAPNDFAIMGGALYFVARDDLGFGLWRSDGTTTGTTPVKLLPGLALALVATADQLFFTVNDPATGYELWRSDGTDAGTRLVKDINPGTAQSFIFRITPVGSLAFFGAYDLIEGGELWRSDGTESGTTRVKAIEPGPGGSNPDGLVAIGGQLYFTADTVAHGRELWTSDGTETGTVEISDVQPGPEGSHPSLLAGVGADLLFAANDGSHGFELWRTDGTPSGTTMVKDIAPGPAGSALASLTAVDNLVFFSADDGVSGREPWRSDGTPAGTFRLLDVQPGPESSMTQTQVIADWGGFAFFGAAAPATGHELWRSDGTPGDTRLVQDIGPGIVSAGLGGPLLSAGGRLFFTAADEAGTELWTLLPELSVSDVTADEGTHALVTASLVPSIDHELAVPFATTDGTAEAGFDYASLSGTLTFAAGVTTQTVDLTVLDDFIDEPDEAFFLDLSRTTSAYLADSRGLVTVRDDDPTLTFSVDDVAVTEGHTGFVSAVFTVRLSGASGIAATVDYATAPGTATSSSDFGPLSGTLTFTPGIATQLLHVPVNGDTLDEPDEFFFLRLSNATAVILGDAEGVARIRDDDGGTIRVSALDRDADLVTDLTVQPGPVADDDLYVLRCEPWSSYEVTVDGASGDLGNEGPLLESVAADFSSVFPSSPVGVGPARTLRIDNDIPVPFYQYIRVRSAGCTLDCGPDDTYRIRLRDTTGRIPRFNETGGQHTLLILQNRSEVALVTHASYWSGSGTRLAGIQITLAPHASTVLATPPGAAGSSGSITVSHHGPHGALAGKAVALDPVSGLAFDTPLTTRPR